MKVTLQLPICLFSILFLFFPNYITILSVPFPLCLSRLKGWTRGTHWPLQLTWARNTKSIHLLSSPPHYFSFMKSKPQRNVSHTFTWSVWHTQGSSLKTELLNNYLWCVHPANISEYTSTPPLQFMFQFHSTYAVTCFQGNTSFKNLTSEQKVPKLSPHLSLF